MHAQPNSLPAPLVETLSAFLEEEAGREALEQARVIVRTQAVDIAELLDWVQRYPASPALRAQATTSLRAALGLPLIPGPPCRS